MRVIHAVQDLFNVISGLAFRQCFPVFVQLHHRPFAVRFEDNIHVLYIIEGPIKADYVFRIKILVDRDLLRHFLPVIAFSNLRFWYDLPGEYTVRL